jgi:hypothetical protein
MRKMHDCDDPITAEMIKQSFDTAHHTFSFPEKYVAYFLMSCLVFIVDHVILQFAFPEWNIWGMSIATISCVTGVRLQYSWEVHIRSEFSIRLRRSKTLRHNHLGFQRQRCWR